MPIVTLAGKKIELVVPASYAVRTEIAGGQHVWWRRTLAAAIGVCWSASSDRNPNRKFQYRGAIPEYGEAVMNHLHEIGATDLEIRAAGAVALDLCSVGIDWGEVAAAEGNSDAGEAPAGENGPPTA